LLNNQSSNIKFYLKNDALRTLEFDLFLNGFVDAGGDILLRVLGDFFLNNLGWVLVNILFHGSVLDASFNFGLGVLVIILLNILDEISNTIAKFSNGIGNVDDSAGNVELKSEVIIVADDILEGSDKLVISETLLDGECLSVDLLISNSDSERSRGRGGAAVDLVADSDSHFKFLDQSEVVSEDVELRTTREINLFTFVLCDVRGSEIDPLKEEEFGLGDIDGDQGIGGNCACQQNEDSCEFGGHMVL